MNEFGIPFVGPQSIVDGQGDEVPCQEYNPEESAEELAYIETQYREIIVAFRESSIKVLGITKSGQNAMGSDINFVEKTIKEKENIHFFYN